MFRVHVTSCHTRAQRLILNSVRTRVRHDEVSGTIDATKIESPLNTQVTMHYATMNKISFLVLHMQYDCCGALHFARAICCHKFLSSKLDVARSGQQRAVKGWISSIKGVILPLTGTLLFVLAVNAMPEP